MDRKFDNHIGAHFHADRYCRINGEWFYSTREKENIGPFPTRELAQEHLDQHLATLSNTVQHRRGAII